MVEETLTTSAGGDLSAPKMVHSYIPMKVVTYVCTKCKAEDRVRFFMEEAPAVCINCWKCHAGFQMPVENMMANRVGMFPNGPAVPETQETAADETETTAATPAVGLSNDVSDEDDEEED